MDAVRSAVSMRGIASSGTDCAEHFLEVLSKPKAKAALAAEIFHGKEVPVGVVKKYLKDTLEIRPV